MMHMLLFCLVLVWFGFLDFNLFPPLAALCVACGILFPQPGIQPMPPAVEVQSL